VLHLWVHPHFAGVGGLHDTLLSAGNNTRLELISPRSSIPASSYSPTRDPTARYPTASRPADRPELADLFDGQIRPVLTEAGGAPLACLQTEHAENTFPALPVRAGENVFAWLARFPSPDHLAAT
jgi:hypothetical protein